MKHTVSLESHIDNARKLKKLKGHKDRLLDALRDLVEATATAQTLTDAQKTALDKAVIALQLWHADSKSH
jgi:hypothetical protein